MLVSLKTNNSNIIFQSIKLHDNTINNVRFILKFKEHIKVFLSVIRVLKFRQ